MFTLFLVGILNDMYIHANYYRPTGNLNRLLIPSSKIIFIEEYAKILGIIR